MSRENVEIIRAMLEAGNAEGWRCQRVLDFYDSDWVGHAVPGWPGPERYQGRAGFQALIDEWTSNFDNFRLDFIDAVEFDGGVVGLANMHGEGKREGIPISTQVGAVTSFRGGRIAETRYFLNWKEALEAVGLRE